VGAAAENIDANYASMRLQRLRRMMARRSSQQYFDSKVAGVSHENNIS
jgi:hypothetical protein